MNENGAGTSVAEARHRRLDFSFKIIVACAAAVWTLYGWCYVERESRTQGLRKSELELKELENQARLKAVESRTRVQTEETSFEFNEVDFDSDSLWVGMDSSERSKRSGRCQLKITRRVKMTNVGLEDLWVDSVEYRLFVGTWVWPKWGAQVISSQAPGVDFAGFENQVHEVMRGGVRWFSDASTMRARSSCPPRADDSDPSESCERATGLLRAQGSGSHTSGWVYEYPKTEHVAVIAVVTTIRYCPVENGLPVRDRCTVSAKEIARFKPGPNPERPKEDLYSTRMEWLKPNKCGRFGGVFGASESQDSTLSLTLSGTCEHNCKGDLKATRASRIEDSEEPGETRSPPLPGQAPVSQVPPQESK